MTGSFPKVEQNVTHNCRDPLFRTLLYTGSMCLTALVVGLAVGQLLFR